MRHFMSLRFHDIIIFAVIFQSCNSPINNPNSKNVDTLLELKLTDSNKLTLIKDQFYKGSDGHLYQKTMGAKEVIGSDTLVDFIYFNGMIPQDLDPLTFEELNGWFAKDKKSVYLYRPLSGGMFIEKLDSADVRTFKIIEGDYSYAMDKNHVFSESSILPGLNPSILKIEKDSTGKIVNFVSRNNSFKPY